MNAGFEKFVGLEYAENTDRVYTKNVQKFLSFVNKLEQDVTPLDIVEWKAELVNEGLSSASIALALTSVNVYYKFLVSMEIVAKNPAQSIKKPKVNNKVKHYMDMDMVEDMVLHAKTLRDKAIVLTFATTGMRVSELTSLTVDQYESMKVDGVNFINIIGKGNKERPVYFNDEVIRAIDDYLDHRQIDSEYLFSSGRGGQIARNNLSNTLKVIARNAGIPFWQDICNHALRSAAATIYCEQGVPVTVVRDLLGHSSLMTTNRYVKTNTASVSNAVMNMKFMK